MPVDEPSVWAQSGRRMKRIPHAPIRPPHLDALLVQREPVQNINATHELTFSPLERVALFITARVGTFGFFLLTVACHWLATSATSSRLARVAEHRRAGNRGSHEGRGRRGSAGHGHRLGSVRRARNLGCGSLGADRRDHLASSVVIRCATLLQTSGIALAACQS